MNDSILAWHFVGETLRDGRPVPADGEILIHEGPIDIRASGLHASRRLIDALNYAPGSILCRVRMAGEIEEQDDKLVARQRVILWRMDATDVLHDFARSSALDVAHLWGMPEIVAQYLMTGDERLRAAARDAVRGAAWDAASDTASAAAGAAAWAAASDSMDAVDAARVAARVAARAAAWAAALDAARAAALDAALDAARTQQNGKLMQMILAAAHQKTP